MILVFFCVWEDARVWAYRNHSFDMHRNYLGPVSFFSILKSPQDVEGGCGWWLDGGQHSLFPRMEGKILCLLTWQATFFCPHQCQNLKVLHPGNPTCKLGQKKKKKRWTHKSSSYRSSPATFTYNLLRFNLSEFNSLSSAVSQGLELWKTRVLFFWLPLQIGNSLRRLCRQVSSHWNFPNIVSLFPGLSDFWVPALLLRVDSLSPSSHLKPPSPTELFPTSSFCPKILSHTLHRYSLCFFSGQLA